MRQDDDSTRFSDEDLRDLVALADGSLPEERRAEVEARVEASPELRAALEEQRQAVDAVRAAASSVYAPSSLRMRLDEQQRAVAPAARRRRFGALSGLLAAAAAAALVVALVLPGGEGNPSVTQIASLSAQPATGPAPSPNAATPALLDKEADGLPYPNWDQSFHWSASGQRDDEVEGRDATTVYYDREALRVGYTIVSGEEIDAPDGAKVHEVDGDKYWTWTTKDGRNAVLWYRDERTCVMAGKGVPPDILVKLASWKGKGAVTT
jgi:hypothetical protein